MRFYLALATARGYHFRRAFDARCVHHAAAEHFHDWGIRGASYALVMRDSQGRRYSFEESCRLRMEACAH